MTASCPTITLRISPRMRCRPSATRSATAAISGGAPAGAVSGVSRACEEGFISSVCQGINDLVDLHPVRLCRELDVARIVGGVRPFPTVAHVRVEVDED